METSVRIDNAVAKCSLRPHEYEATFFNMKNCIFILGISPHFRCKETYQTVSNI
jgi:hypothetical protein